MGRSGPRLIERLERQPYRFDFVQAVRLLLLWRRRGRETGPAAPDGAVVRFRSNPSLDFPASQIQDLAAAGTAPPGAGIGDQGRAMMVNFIGLTGPLGVLPRHYTEEIITRRYLHRDRSLHAFLDIFHHRLTQHFYAAWAKHNLWHAPEQGTRDPLLGHLLALAGLGMAPLRDRLATGPVGFHDTSVAYYAGLLSAYPRSPLRVAQVLADWLGRPVAIEQNRGRWLSVPQSERRGIGGRQAGRLGRDLALGARAWDRQSAVRVTVGPLDRATFEDLLPLGARHGPVMALLRFALGPAIDFDLNPVLARDAARPVRLGGGDRIGWSAWLVTKPPARDLADAVLLPGPMSRPTRDGDRR
ncbi:MAG: type VI secretion system baseplate subunit TssG [Alphaproteobacteria bacterium]